MGQRGYVESNLLFQTWLRSPEALTGDFPPNSNGLKATCLFVHLLFPVALAPCHKLIYPTVPPAGH